MSLTTFAQEALADFQSIAALAPSSRFLAQAMVEPLPLKTAKVVVEFGPGTGVMTRELLRLCPPDATVIAFEINPRFLTYLQDELSDPRLHLVNAPAAQVSERLARLGVERVDAVLSSLGLSMIPDSQNQAMMHGLLPLLHETSVLTQFQYLHRMRLLDGRVYHYDVGRFLDRYFGIVERRIVWRNLPPAFVFNCRIEPRQ